MSIKFNIDLTKHGEERKNRTDNEGPEITDKEITSLINRLSKHIGYALINDTVFINDKKSQLLLKDRRPDLPTTDLNVVVSVSGDITKDVPIKLVVITVMRKSDFKQMAHKSNIIKIDKDGTIKHEILKK